MNELFLSITVGKEATTRTFDFPDTHEGRKQAHQALARLGEYIQNHTSPPVETFALHESVRS